MFLERFMRSAAPSVKDAEKILGETKVFTSTDCIKQFGVNGGPFKELSIPFTPFQLRKVAEVTGGNAQLFVRYATLEQVVRKQTGRIRVPTGLFQDEGETGCSPRFCLVAFGFGDAAKYLKKKVAGWGLHTKTASFTTGVSAALLSLQCGTILQSEIKLATKRGGAAAMRLEGNQLITYGVDPLYSAASMIEFRSLPKG
jgi:hypothetical protein